MRWPWPTLADVLDERARGGDRQRAAELRTEAIATATQLGMDRRAEEWRQRGTHRATCRRHGSCWSVELDGRCVTVPHCVGLEYLAELLANPDVELDALALASGHVMTARRAADAPVLDRRAAEEYRRRIAELHEEIDDADLAADLERSARARLELDQLVDHLARSTGLHGDRRFTDDAERARVSVHKALKRALRAIGAADSVIGDRLAARIATGFRCVYRPA